jgi:CRP-like cAMP-binding protein
MPHDYVFRVGELGEHLYIIVEGAVEIIAPDNCTVWTTLRYAGEQQATPIICV